jgi:hypothetical protein
MHNTLYHDGMAAYVCDAEKKTMGDILRQIDHFFQGHTCHQVATFIIMAQSNERTKNVYIRLLTRTLIRYPLD